MSASLQPGEIFLDRYRIRKLIAEGGMASIYLADDQRTGTPVAIKTLYEYYSENRVVKMRFLEEGRIQQFLEHPNVVQVYQVVGEPKLAIIMEYVKGPTLDDHLIENGPMDEQRVLELIIPVMSAVGFAHSRGIIHRDIKPSNILLKHRDGGLLPKVMDFGVAKVQDGPRDLTATGTTVGTLHYMSPEQIVGSKNIDGRADIYSLGVTLYKLVTGEVPFNAPTEFALMMAQVEAPPLPPTKLREGLSQEFEEIVLKAMAKKPGERFQTIREFTSALLSLDVGGGRNGLVDTITDRVPVEILEFAMSADEIATDRTGEMNFSEAFSETADTREKDRKPGLSTKEEMSATIKINRRNEGGDPDPTEELRHSQIIRLTTQPEDHTEEEFYDPQASTVPIPSLQSRRQRALEEQQGQGDSLDTTAPGEELDAVTTRPSRPSASLRDSGEYLEPGEEEKDTNSVEKRVRTDSRGGVVVMDSDANSRDVTAPKVSQQAYDRILRGREQMSGGSKRLEKSSRAGEGSGARNTSGRRNTSGTFGEPEGGEESSRGPAVVFGKDYADTDNRTRHRMKGQKQRTRLPVFQTDFPIGEEPQKQERSSTSDSSLQPLKPFQGSLPGSPSRSQESDWKKTLLLLGLGAIVVFLAAWGAWAFLV